MGEIIGAQTSVKTLSAILLEYLIVVSGKWQK